MSDQPTIPPTVPEDSTREQRPSERGGRSRDRAGRRRHHAPSQQPSRQPGVSINIDELREVIELIAEHGFTEFELEREGFRVHLRRDAAPQPVSAAAPLAAGTHHVSAETRGAAPETTGSTASGSQPRHPGTQSERAAAADEDLHIITAPIVGTFYRSASPTAEPFVRLGSRVQPETVVCIIEAMKLMNEIQAETTGEVVKIYVENGQPVEYNQPLYGIRT